MSSDGMIAPKNASGKNQVSKNDALQVKTQQNPSRNVVTDKDEGQRDTDEDEF